MAEYIEREAAIEAVTVWYKKACRPENMSSYNMGERAAYTTTISEITELPAVDVRPAVRGKWEDVEVTYVADKTTLPFERISSMRCNQCNRYHTEIYYYGNPTEMAHYCPNCGADMRETNDEKA